MPNPNVGLHTANAATCDPGYYLKDGECQLCNPNLEAVYCPGDNEQHACPTTNTDYAAFSGWTVLSGHEAKWANIKSRSIQDCRSSFYFQDPAGNQILTEFPFDGVRYWGSDNYIYYYQAGDGYYLAPYRQTDHERDWYGGAKPCTNAPTHAHYTGPGTPDSADGRIVDANDCPWACDAGYRQVDDTCQPLCATGIASLHAGGTAVPLFGTRPSEPALVVQTAGGVCYGNLTPGRGTGINITVNGATYHLQ